jgi:hypothetical protein
MDLGDAINVIKDMASTFEQIETHANVTNSELENIGRMLEDIRDKMPDAHERCATAVMKAMWTNLDPQSPDNDMLAIAQIAAVQGKMMQMALEDFDKRYPAPEPGETDYIAKSLDELDEAKNETD